MHIPKWLEKKLSEQDCKDIKETITEIEKYTSGEVVPIVVKSSSTVGHVPYILLLTLIFLDYFSGLWSLSLEVLPLPQLLIFLIHFIIILLLTRVLANLPLIQRQLTPKADQTFQVEQRAINEFYDHHMHHTEAKTGILIFVSMMERMAVVVGDEHINKKLAPQDWQRSLDRILEELHKGQLKQGLIKGLEASRDLLKQHFPIQEGDKNELANDLILKD